MIRNVLQPSSMRRFAISLVVSSTACGGGGDSPPHSSDDLSVVADSEDDNSESTGALAAYEDAASPSAQDIDQLKIDHEPINDDGGDRPPPSGFFQPVTFFTGTYFGGERFTPDIPLSAAQGNYFYADLPSSHSARTHSYNLKGNCEFYHHSENDQRGDTHGRFYSSQYFATTGVPTMRSYQIRCWDSRPEYATVFESQNYRDSNYRLFESVLFASEVARQLWSYNGIDSIKINNAYYGDLSVVLLTSFGIFTSLFQSQKVIPRTAEEMAIDEFIFRADNARQCREANACYRDTRVCDYNSPRRITTLRDCDQLGGRSYCTSTRRCVDPSNGFGIP